MKKNILDIYTLIGLLISVGGVLISIYGSPKNIPIEYILGGIIFLSILTIVIILSNKFKDINDKFESINENLKKVEYLDKRFKTLEDLSEIRLNIRELQRKVFK